ncbi:hypothetical protein FOCC_FOCC000306, partial [Frankliniella occidentalis]
GRQAPRSPRDSGRAASPWTTCARPRSSRAPSLRTKVRAGAENSRWYGRYGRAADASAARCSIPDGGVYRMISSAVYEEWYFRKEQELIERRRREQEQERRNLEEMEKAYEMWRKRIKEQEKEEAEKKKRAEEKRRQEMDRKEKERKEMNEKSFERWKAEKEQQIKKTEERTRRKETRLEAMEQEKRQQRQYEAQQAFLVWLDDVEDKEAAAHLQAQQRAQLQHRGRAAAVNGPSFRPARRHSCSD